MTTELSVERVTERGRAYLAWARAGGDVQRLVKLDYDCRVLGRITDWPGWESSGERRQGIPDLDLAEYERQRTAG